MTGAVELNLKRIYDPAAPDDGFRVLVDRLWPRGVSHERAALDLWAKDVAPSDHLRVAVHHEGMPWEQFVAQYRAELAGPTRAALDELRAAVAGRPVVTLLFASRDTAHNEAVVLRGILSS